MVQTIMVGYHVVLTVAKCYLQWELNPGPLTFVPCMLLSEVIPHLLEVSGHNCIRVQRSKTSSKW